MRFSLQINKMICEFTGAKAKEAQKYMDHTSI
jgi:hypothetical protein